jgi:hypothetical protein
MSSLFHSPRTERKEWFRVSRLQLFVLIGVFSVVTASAQDRKYAIGTTIDLMGGSTNRLNSLTPVSPNAPNLLYYGAYPSITFTSAGARSAVNGSYSFGINRTESGSKLHSNSHAANLGWNGTLSRNWRLSLSDSFSLTSDSATFNAFRAVTPKFDEPGFVFDPVARQIVSRTNRASVGADYTIGGKSSLSFTGSHLLRMYSDDAASGVGLTDQQQFSAGVSYRRQLGKDSWNLGYTGSYYKFDQFQDVISQDVISHSGQVGYSAPVWRDFVVNISVGAAHTRQQNTTESYVGYNTSASLQKTLADNALALFFSQSSGTATGLGTISDTQRLGFSVSRQARNLNIFLSMSAYETRARLGNLYDVRGLQGSVTIGIPVSRTLAVQGGLQYQRQDQSSLYQFDQKRVFVSLRYNNPGLFRFVR